jgi:hypothetical protein
MRQLGLQLEQQLQEVERQGLPADVLARCDECMGWGWPGLCSAAAIACSVFLDTLPGPHCMCQAPDQCTASARTTQPGTEGHSSTLFTLPALAP